MRKFIALLGLMTLIPSLAMALPTAARMKSKLNQNVVASDGSLFRMGDQLTNKKVQVMAVTFDTFKTGSTTDSLRAVGSHALKDVDGSLATIPSGALVKEVWMDVTNTILSNAVAPKLCFQLQTGCDLKLGQTIEDYHNYGATSFRQILPTDGTTVMKLTADRIVYGVVSGGALTGGTINLFIEYFLPN